MRCAILGVAVQEMGEIYSFLILMFGSHLSGEARARGGRV